MRHHDHLAQIAGFMLEKLLNKPELNWVAYYYEDISKVYEDSHGKVCNPYIIMIAVYQLAGWEVLMNANFGLVARAIAIQRQQPSLVVRIFL